MQVGGQLHEQNAVQPQVANVGVAVNGLHTGQPTDGGRELRLHRTFRRRDHGIGGDAGQRGDIDFAVPGEREFPHRNNRGRNQMACHSAAQLPDQVRRGARRIVHGIGQHILGGNNHRDQAWARIGGDHLNTRIPHPRQRQHSVQHLRRLHPETPDLDLVVGTTDVAQRLIVRIKHHHIAGPVGALARGCGDKAPRGQVGSVTVAQRHLRPRHIQFSGQTRW